MSFQRDQPGSHHRGHVFVRGHAHYPPHPNQLLPGILGVFGGSMFAPINPHHILTPIVSEVKYRRAVDRPVPVVAQN